MAERGPIAWLRRRWPRPPVVPVVRLAGVIGGPAALRGGGLTLAGVNGALERAFKIRNAKAVALAVNSPGGSPVQSSLIAARVRALAAEKERPVLTFIEDVGASGGYWLALAGDEIFADSSSIIGSIGVISAGFGLNGAIARLGVERRLHTAGRKKALLDPFRPEDPDDVARLQAILGDVHDGFKAMVRERRGSRLNGDDADLFEGQIWTGRQAKELGLIDGLGNLHEVLRARFGDKVKLVQIVPGRSWLQRRLGMGRGPDARELVEGALAGLEERAHWARFGL